MSDQPKRRGRKPVPDPGERVCAWVRGSEYDALCEVARLNRCSLSGIVRHAIRVVILNKSITVSTAPH